MLLDLMLQGEASKVSEALDNERFVVRSGLGYTSASTYSKGITEGGSKSKNGKRYKDYLTEASFQPFY